MNTFKDNIHRANLFDLGFKGPNFTWKRGAIWERLYRILIIGLCLSALLLLIIIPPPPFRYLNMWAAHPSYNKYIADLWKVQEAENEVKKLEYEEQIGNVEEKELLTAQNNLLSAIEYQEKFLEHKWLHDDADIAKDVINYYKNLLNQEQHFRNYIEKANFSTKLNFTASLKLTDIPNEKEIWNAISSIDNNKSAGPDGFTAEFYKKSWEVIKIDVIAAATSFFKGNNLPKYFCASTTVLIRQIAETNYSWELGNGEIKFWLDNWCPKDWLSPITNIYNSDLKMADCCYGDEWSLGLETVPKSVDN
ncbi:uncharacterized protein LOC110038640 [Phalaenopsis equestris]|uniref:uncharacterized protein LOC110038640 n=1 Tax=Phalaenopsis equestris TaxID=78828 RepID=UPI0009E53DC3|nr:uncharacterized protein LOC110038640 [Phalaenopsis equestris]